MQNGTAPSAIIEAFSFEKYTHIYFSFRRKCFGSEKKTNNNIDVLNFVDGSMLFLGILIY